METMICICDRRTKRAEKMMLRPMHVCVLPCPFDQYPEVGPNWSHLKFKGRGQRDTCVTDAKGIVEVIMLLPGQQAARVR